MPGDTTESEVVSTLLDYARQFSDIERYFTKLACDIAQRKVMWTADESRAVEKEMGEIAGKMLRGRDTLPKAPPR